MGRLLWIPLVLLVLVLPARANQDTSKLAAARVAMQELASSDEAVRAEAAERLVELNWIGAEYVARHGEELDDRTWAVVSEAFLSRKSPWTAAPFVAGAYAAPPAHRRRLLVLAHELDPEAGVERTDGEVAEAVERLLLEASHVRCSTGYDVSIAVLGHQAVPPLLARLRKEEKASEGGWTTCSALSILAEREDLPAIRALFLAGKTNLADALDHLQRWGVPVATRVLLDAVVAGHLDSRVTRALGGAPDPEPVRKAMEAWVAGQTDVDEDNREDLSVLFVDLEARESVPTLESWAATSKEPAALVAIAGALVHFGDPKGVGLLVHVVGERRILFPCRPPTPEERAASSSPGRLCPAGFSTWERRKAAVALSGIAGPGVFGVPADGRPPARGHGGERESDDDFLDRAAVAYRQWWEGAMDTLRFEPATRRWTVEK